MYSPALYHKLLMHSILHQKYITEATKTTSPLLDNARIQAAVLYPLGHPVGIDLPN